MSLFNLWAYNIYPFILVFNFSQQSFTVLNEKKSCTYFLRVIPKYLILDATLNGIFKIQFLILFLVYNWFLYLISWNALQCIISSKSFSLDIFEFSSHKIMSSLNKTFLFFLFQSVCLFFLFYPYWISSDH